MPDRDFCVVDNPFAGDGRFILLTLCLQARVFFVSMADFSSFNPDALTAMPMAARRNEFDVTNQVQTTSPEAVRLAILATLSPVYGGKPLLALDSAMTHVGRLFNGQVPGFQRCDTPYHNLQHTLDVALAMARLIHGHEVAQSSASRLGEELAQLGVICALFHDAGYIKREADRRRGSGAQYTRNHVTRGGQMLQSYLPQIGLGAYAKVAPKILHYSGYERPVARIRMANIRYRLLGYMLGSADMIAQLSDRCYLEKCYRHLYPEFVEGGIAVKHTPAGDQVIFASAEDLIFRTPQFFATAQKRLDDDLAGAYRYAESHFGGENPYLSEIRKNIAFAEEMRNQKRVQLRRKLPG